MPSKQIESDGKSYTFTPGKGGSLTAKDTRPKEPMIRTPSRVGKTIISPELEGVCKACGQDTDSNGDCPSCEPSSYSKSMLKARRPATIGSVRG